MAFALTKDQANAEAKTWKEKASELADKVDKLAQRAKGLAVKGEEAMGHMVQSMEVGMSALGFGWAEGRYGSIELLGIPANLGASVVLHGLGYFGMAGKHSEHLHNLGDGALASYLHTMGVGIGARSRQPAARPGGATSGANVLPRESASSSSEVHQAQPLSDNELAALAAMRAHQVQAQAR